MTNKMALEGLKILDISTMVAAPWSSTYLADFGADVIKVEHPEYGDHARNYGKQKKGVPLFWKTLNRNKRFITLNLSKEKGQEIFKELVKDVDVVIENFRPGTLERWNIGWDVLEEINPSLILLRTTGFGQSGPYSKRAGFGTVAEAMSGFTSINGESDGPATLPGLALADGVSSVFGSLSIMIALFEKLNNPEGRGQNIDISLYEPLMRFMEAHLMAYDQLGDVAERVGNGSVSIAPRNAYQTKGGEWVALSGASQSVTKNVFKAIGKEELFYDERFSTNENRMRNVKELDKLIGGWIKERNLEEVVEVFNNAGAVIGPMYDVSQLYEDPHYIYRESFVTVEDEELGEMHVPNVVAKFSRTPGKVKSLGQKKGMHNNEIYSELLNISQEELELLTENKII
ncbi:CoA transferase [Virgibacillus sp. C22-A2]|uniref:CoA transferase n=1 Tax=Virgibacillus tibetensis TaxID=3042313 RepID=A0ABU6KDC3_9BACI|nr:CoA transferase [Virgibacillus sp. C22-A2]